jgi:hypothetical protein
LEACLQKDPERRLRTFSELRHRLESGRLNRIPISTDAEIALSTEAARRLFLFIQVGYLAMYCAALYYVEALEGVTLPVVTIAAMSGIAVRLYLLSSVALVHPAAGRNFHRLFPVLLLLDGAWAASPLLAVRTIGFGIALAGAAGLAYLPFSQRTLMHRIYGTNR